MKKLICDLLTGLKHRRMQKTTSKTKKQTPKTNQPTNKQTNHKKTPQAPLRERCSTCSSEGQ